MEIFEEIERYVNGDMSGQELTDFKSQLSVDEELQEHVALYLKTILPLEKKHQHEVDRQVLKGTLENMGGKYFQKQSSSKTIMLNRYWKYAAAIAALLIVGYLMFNNGHPTYEQFAQHSALNVQAMGDNTENLIKASDLFNDQNYAEALPLLNRYLEEHPSDAEILLAKAIALIEVDRTDAAREILKNNALQQSIFKDKAIWYGALISLKKGELNDCKKKLLQIKKRSNQYESAQELLNAL